MEEVEGIRTNTFYYYHEGFKYHIDKRLEGRYRCAIRRTAGCSGAATVNDDGTVHVTNPHNHAPCDMEQRLTKLKQQMYTLIETSVEPIKKIFDDISELDSEAAKHLSYASMKSCLYKRRSNYLPAVPDTLSALRLSLSNHSVYKNMYKGYVKADDGSSAILLSSNDLLTALNTSSEIYVDGTFSIVPRVPKIAQLYTIHTRAQDIGIATIFILCESRTHSLYRAICEKVIELVPNIQENVKFIMGDYEKAAIAAFKEYFINASAHGCWFHFNQAILRKWRHLDLKNAPKTLISMAMSLPLLPHTYFNEGFALLQQQADDICDAYPDTLHFMCYMRKTWLTIAEQVSVYRCPARTNNLVESFHNTARNVVGNSHPSFWIFMHKLRKIITTQEIDLGRANNNLQVRRPRPHTVCRRNTTIIKKQKDLVEGRISVAVFLKSFTKFTDKQRYSISAILDEDNTALDDMCEDVLSLSLTNNES